MKLYNRIISGMFFAGGLVSLWSCTAEEPFKDTEAGEALVRLSVNMSTYVTRAGSDELSDNCKVYISNSNGVLHKWIGLNNIPSKGIYLRYGNYVAEAWAGDSVAASFTDKYYKGSTRFNVSEKQLANNIIVNCKISNVVISVDASSLAEEMKSSLKLNVASTTGNLDFDSSNLNAKGYFMLHWDSANGKYEDNLTYTLDGEDIDGTPFHMTGEIPGVKQSHEYQLILKNNIPAENVGGAAISLQIREFELEVDDTVIIHGKPEFAWQNTSLDLEGQIYGKDGNFEDYILCIGAYDEFSSVILSTENETLRNELGSGWFDLVGSSATVKEELKGKGFLIESGKSGVYEQFKITLESRWLQSLPLYDKEYVMTVIATDNRGMSNTMMVRIANMEEALDIPFTVNAGHWQENLLAIRANSVEIAVNIHGDADNLALKYRKQNDTSWQTYTLSDVQKGKNIIRLTGLDPDTQYDCKIVGGDLTGDSYQFESAVESFKTEGKFQIPNSSMENWFKNGRVWEPSSSDNNHEFWDTGNHGSTTLSENDNLTTQFTEYYHTGGSCARLESKFVGLVGNLGKHGAGNIFTGSYAGTSGTNGIIEFGKKYNNSHPTKVRVWVNYRPKVADKGGKAGYIAKGEYDQGQIYIALSDKIVTVNTGDASTLVTQERAPELFLAYGEKTFVGDYGDDNTLAMVEIPFEYYDKAKTIMPEYLIIVCCASKYGDYFSGGEGSLMFVDDFELIYE